MAGTAEPERNLGYRTILPLALSVRLFREFSDFSGGVLVIIMPATGEYDNTHTIYRVHKSV